MNLVEFLKEKNLTISSAESFTGGLFSANITSISGASSVFKGGINCYSVESKINVLHVNKETIDNFGTVSKECCTEMVKNCQKLFNSDIAVAFTGNAGPTASENKPVGLCYIGLCYKDKLIINELSLKGSREEIRNQAIKLIEELIYVII